MKVEAWKCDNCGFESPNRLVGWMRLTYTSEAVVEYRDTSPKDFCSWRCAEMYSHLEAQADAMWSGKANGEVRP